MKSCKLISVEVWRANSSGISSSHFFSFGFEVTASRQYVLHPRSQSGIKASNEMNTKVRISIVTPCYNEEGNVEELYQRVCAVIENIPAYDFVLLFIDNQSTDNTVDKIKQLAAVDKRVRLIVNTRNFGHIRSPYHGILNGGGAATIYLASDLQDPPELIPEFIRYWEEGFKVVYAAKPVINASPMYAFLRKTYYRILDMVSAAPLVKNITGFGIYDREVIDRVREIADPFPYLRGLICELGFSTKLIMYEEPRRKRGVSKSNIYSLYDIAMLGLVSHSKVPLRVAAFAGFVIGLLSLASAFLYAILKVIFWNTFPLGVAPLIIAIFFLFGMMFLFIGLLGEYVASIHTYVQRRPVVIEKERVNFDDNA